MAVRYTPLKAPDGQPMLVVRPSNPELALKLAEKAVEEQDADLFASLPDTVEQAGGEYTFVGYLASRLGSLKGSRCIVDDKGAYVGEIQAGDSFISQKRPEDLPS